MANFDGSGLSAVASFGLGTGMYVLTRETRDCFCMEYSGSGLPWAWTLTYWGQLLVVAVEGHGISYSNTFKARHICSSYVLQQPQLHSAGDGLGRCSGPRMVESRWLVWNYEAEGNQVQVAVPDGPCIYVLRRTRYICHKPIQTESPMYRLLELCL